MSASKSANDEITLVWKRIEKQVGELKVPQSRKPHWRLAVNGTLSIFVAYSKYHRQQDWYFYGINERDIKTWLGYKRAFVVFVMNTGSQALVVPAQVVFEHIEDGPQDHLGNYKPNIVREGKGYAFRDAQGDNLRPFYNNYASMKPGRKAGSVIRAKRTDTRKATQQALTKSPRVVESLPKVITVTLAHDVAKVFRTSDEVNEALRWLMKVSTTTKDSITTKDRE